MTVYGLGYIPDKPDARDVRFTPSFGKRALASGKTLRTATPLLNQYATSRCVAFAFGDALLMREVIVGVTPIVQPSFNGIYKMGRRADGLHLSDGGSVPRSVIKAAFAAGVPSERLHPSRADAESINDSPSPEALIDGQQRKGGRYVRLFNIDDMIEAIENGLPAITGLMVDEAFQRLSPGNDVWRPGGAKLGGHCCVYVEVDRVNRCVVGKNTWGASHGDGGFFRVPFDVMQREMRDSWAIDGWPLIQGAA